ncbi:hypothetical protein P152DRAFT_458510 [Eremomyces bilateralis CBS 781.70]|uniref:Uncharacterized protein n=1 Tax=Eremomyces bilateralis CBS 781.70 TaxID=1392243 RepID=A0A6G1G462_9PEZI|nr:uncharacterized protein P152DRAFT_458510 [Eremomyces bilateralis CBS 781.70]KAF1812696.1 hypothetical protein P152DRAFT_458510 [Eremomyces bilateralis CBS 781.70]
MGIIESGFLQIADLSLALAFRHQEGELYPRRASHPQSRMHSLHCERLRGAIPVHGARSTVTQTKLNTLVNINVFSLLQELRIDSFEHLIQLMGCGRPLSSIATRPSPVEVSGAILLEVRTYQCLIIPIYTNLKGVSRVPRAVDGPGRARQK